MSVRVAKSSLPMIAASDIPGYAPVTLFGASAGPRAVVAIATVNQEPIGVTGEVGAPGGGPVTVYDRGSIMQGVAGATIADAADIGVIGATTVAGPSGNFSQPLLGAVVAASGSAKWRVGQAATPAVPGQVFSFHVSPRQLSGLA